MPSIWSGAASVTRSSADENNGYSWSVTFLTELGALDLVEFDNRDMTGTVVTGVVSLGLITTVLPAARAGANFQIAIIIG